MNGYNSIPIAVAQRHCFQVEEMEKDFLRRKLNIVVSYGLGVLLVLEQESNGVFGAERKLMLGIGCFRFCPIPLKK